MINPMMPSMMPQQGSEDTQLDPRIQQSVAQALAKKVPDSTIRNILRYVEKVNPDDYLGGGNAPSAPGNGLFGMKLRELPPGTAPGAMDGGRPVVDGNTLDQVQHWGGIGLRGIAQGAGTIPSYIAKAANIGAVPGATSAMGQVPQGAMDLGNTVSNAAGLDTAATPGERDVQAMGNAVGMSATMPGGLSAGALKLAAGSGLASQVAANQGSGPIGQFLAGTAVAAGLPFGVGFLGAEGIKMALLGGATRRKAAEDADALITAGNPNAARSAGQLAQGIVHAGTPEDVADAAGRGGASAIEGMLSKYPAAVGPFTKMYATQDAQFMQRRDALADALTGGRVTEQDAAMAARRSVVEDWLPQMKAKKQQLYNKVYSQMPAMPGGAPIMPDHTTQLFHMTGSVNGADQIFKTATLTNPTFKTWATAMQEQLTANAQQGIQGMDFNTLKSFRSEVGEMLDNPDLIETIDRGQLKALYGSLTDDMTTGIQRIGSPGALKDWETANAYYKKNLDIQDRFLQPLINKRTAEQAWGSMMSGTKVGAENLRNVLDAISPEARKMVASSVIRKMGLTSDGMFSPQNFLSAWSEKSLSREAKEALFSGWTDPSGKLRQSLDELADGMQTAQTQRRRFPNLSGTAQNMAAQTLVRQVTTGIGTVAVGAATGNPAVAMIGGIQATQGPLTAFAANRAARWMTNPKTAAWLASMTKVPVGDIARGLTILGTQSKRWDPESRSLADEMLQQWQNVDWSQVQLQQAVEDSIPR